MRKHTEFSQDQTRRGLWFHILARSVVWSAWLCDLFPYKTSLRADLPLAPYLGDLVYKNDN